MFPTLRRAYTVAKTGRCNLPLANGPVSLVSEQFVTKQFVQKDPRTILFLHGFLGSKKNYRSIGKKLSRELGFNVIGLDMRNHGESPKALPLNYETMAKDVEQYLDTNKLSKLVVVGHSMGAKVAMVLALKRPELIDSLVVVDNMPAYTPLDPSFRRNLKALQEIEQDKISSKLNGRIIQNEVQDILTKHGIEPMVQTFLLSNMVKGKDVITFQNPNTCFIEHDAIEIVSQWPKRETLGQKYRGPVLVIRSTQSGFISSIESFDDYFESVKVIDFDTGHYIITEKSKEFTDTLIEFIK
ncbi:probable alcohol acetyltransferase [[Candida] anglica]|uniref:Probable alcohol acetyltransferase n=1 Tax=[Candida] anglica TaxID=148631 RepID=A0ABP0E643_9ASCO